MSRRVLVARLDSMGDVLVSGPAIRAVAAAAEVQLLCGPRGADAAALLPGVAAIRVANAPWITGTGDVDERSVRALRRAVAEADASEAVILTSFHQSPLPLALLLRLGGYRRITGASVDAAGGLLDVRLVPGEDRPDGLPEELPEPERALHIAAAAGFPLPPGDDGALRVRPGERPAGLPGRYVVVHPGAAVPSRAWPAERHTEAVAALADAGHAVVVTGGPDELALTARVAGSSGIDLGGRLDLGGLAAVLAGADVLVCGNTGPAHLAAAVGTPVVSLYAPVVPAVRWAPYGVPVELLGNQDAPCRDTRARICPVPGHPCLTSVTPADVVAACRRLREGVPA